MGDLAALSLKLGAEIGVFLESPFKSPVVVIGVRLGVWSHVVGTVAQKLRSTHLLASERDLTKHAVRS